MNIYWWFFVIFGGVFFLYLPSFLLVLTNQYRYLVTLYREFVGYIAVYNPSWNDNRLQSNHLKVVTPPWNAVSSSQYIHNKMLQSDARLFDKKMRLIRYKGMALRQWMLCWFLQQAKQHFQFWCIKQENIFFLTIFSFLNTIETSCRFMPQLRGDASSKNFHLILKCKILHYYLL